MPKFQLLQNQIRRNAHNYIAKIRNIMMGVTLKRATIQIITIIVNTIIGRLYFSFLSRITTSRRPAYLGLINLHARENENLGADKLFPLLCFMEPTLFLKSIWTSNGPNGVQRKMKVNPNYLRYVWVYFRPEHKSSCHKKDCHIGLTLFTGERESGPIGWTNDTNGPFLEMAPLLGFY